MVAYETNGSGEVDKGRPLAEQQFVSNFFAGAILQSDDCGGGPCFAGGLPAGRRD